MKYLSVIMMVFTFGFLSCSQQQKSEEELGQARPFELFDTDSVSFTLTDYKNKPILIHFWADWCPHCRQEFARIQKAYEKIKPEGYEIVAINSGQSKEHVLEIKTTFGLTFPLLVDEEAKTAELYGVSGLPTSFFIDRTGRIREKYIGWLKEQQILDIFQKLEDEG
jgi:peroxiredoxin